MGNEEQVRQRLMDMNNGLTGGYQREDGKGRNKIFKNIYMCSQEKKNFFLIKKFKKTGAVYIGKSDRH